MFRHEWYHQSVDIETFKLEKEEIPLLKKFIEETELPFKDPVLELAFKNFENSYDVGNSNLKFLY